MRWNILSAAVLLVLLAGCSQKLILVEPYEKEYFAEDKMQFTPMKARSEFENHVYQIREGSAGGESGFQGGCGCR